MQRISRVAQLFNLRVAYCSKNSKSNQKTGTKLTILGWTVYYCKKGDLCKKFIVRAMYADADCGRAIGRSNIQLIAFRYGLLPRDFNDYGNSWEFQDQPRPQVLELKAIVSFLTYCIG